MRHLEEFRELQRPDLVRDLIRRVMPQKVERFDAAEHACMLSAIESMQVSAAAAELRTLLDGIKGELWAMARLGPKEDMTWSKAAERLRSGAPSNSLAYEQIVRQERIHTQLYEDLSGVLKRRRDGDLAVLWARMLGHIEALLSAVDALRGSSKGAAQVIP